MRFFGRKIAFFAFAAHLCGMCKTRLGESYFLPNHNRFTIRQLQTPQTVLKQEDCVAGSGYYDIGGLPKK